MTEYMQLRQSDLSALADADETVTYVAYALFCAWFPWHRTSGPVGDDLENWKAIAVDDAKVAVDALRMLGWTPDAEGAKVNGEEMKGDME
jgi:hypothetical protein